MAATKEIKVVINGEEYLSKVAKQAGDGMETGFVGKIKGWVSGFTDIRSALKTVGEAVGAVKDFVLDSFAAYDNYSASQNKLAAQSKLTGVSLKDLKETAKTAREEFGLSSATANDAATTVAKYAARAGDATKKNELLAAALDLGAASGLTAAESMDALEMGLRGQDEGFDKLLGKNPSTLWKEYADANGLAVGKMTDTQKRMAELTAVVNAGNVVQGSYNERMQTGAGQQELLNNRMENAKIAFGAALQPVRMLAIQGLTKIIEVAAPVVEWIGKIVNLVGLELGMKFQDARAAVGGFVETMGRLLHNTSMEEWGRAQVKAAADAKDGIVKLGIAHQEAAQVVETTQKRQTAVVRESTDERKQRLQTEKNTIKQFADEMEQWAKKNKLAAKDTSDALEDVSKILDGALKVALEGADNQLAKITASFNDPKLKSSPELMQLLRDKSQGYVETLKLMADAHQVLIDKDHGLPPKDAAQRLDDIIERLKEQALTEVMMSGNYEDHAKRMDVINQLIDKRGDLTKQAGKEEEANTKVLEKNREHISKMVDSTLNIVDAAIALGHAMGVVDDKTAEVLTVFEDIASSIGRIYAGDVAGGVSGLVGAIANLASMASANARASQAIVSSNTREIARLTDEVGNISITASGKDMGNVAKFLSENMPSLSGDTGKMRPEDKIASEKAFRDALLASGLSYAKLEQVAEAMNIQIRTKEGAINWASLPQLLDALKSVTPGHVGSTFKDQYEFQKQLQDLEGNSGASRAQAIAAWLATQSRAFGSAFDMNDLGKSRDNLLELFRQMNNGKGLSNDVLGSLSGQEFQDALLDLIKLIDDAKGTTGTTGTTPPPSGSDGINPPPDATIPPDTTGIIPPPLAETPDMLAELLAELQAFHVDSGSYYAQHLDVARGMAADIKTMTVNLGGINASAIFNGNVDSADGRAFANDQVQQIGRELFRVLQTVAQSQGRTVT